MLQKYFIQKKKLIAYRAYTYLVYSGGPKYANNDTIFSYGFCPTNLALL